MRQYLSLVKFSHTVFALPFAMVGFTLGIKEEFNSFSLIKLILVLLCMVFARNAAMAFNRYKDRAIDAINDRTKMREIPSGVINVNHARLFIIVNVIAFILTTYFINQLCFLLSPIALLVILGYTYTKRFTYLCHIVLGLGLSLSPIGSYLAVTGYFSILPILLGVSIIFWVSGFDIIYALQDESFDRSQSLHSIPVVLGRKKALLLARILHLTCAIVLIYTLSYAQYYYPDLSFLSIIGLAIFLSLLAYQHMIVNENDLSKVNMAFFTTNGIASVLFGTMFIIDLIF
jgi:4-hydroxybenzoate polyprenyltransferase